MSQENERSPELNALEAALSAIAPARNQFDRDALMYRAGMAAAEASMSPGQRSRSHRAAWLWPLATAASTLAAATLGVLYAGSNSLRLAQQPTERIVERTVERIVEVPVYLPASAAPADSGDAATSEPWTAALTAQATSSGVLSANSISGSSSTGSYLQLRDTAPARGVDTLGYLQGMREASSAPAASYSDLRRDLVPNNTSPAATPDRFNSLPQPAPGTRT